MTTGWSSIKQAPEFLSLTAASNNDASRVFRILAVNWKKVVIKDPNITIS